MIDIRVVEDCRDGSVLVEGFVRLSASDVLHYSRKVPYIDPINSSRNDCVEAARKEVKLTLERIWHAYSGR